MNLDWTTFGLEIVNFLALVWILKRFLYQPVLAILAQRRAAIDSTLAAARELETGARTQQAQYAARLADWEREKARALAQLQDELARERDRRLEALEQQLAEERARQAAIEARQQALRWHELETAAIAQAQRFARVVFGRLSAPAVEHHLLDLLLDDWRQLPGDTLARLRADLDASPDGFRVVSAFPLPPAARARLGDALAQRLECPLAIDFAEDPALLAGFRIALGAWQLRLNLADDIADFAAAANHAG